MRMCVYEVYRYAYYSTMYKYDKMCRQTVLGTFIILKLVQVYVYYRWATMKRLNFGNNVTRGRACEGQRFIYGAKGILAHVFRKFGACTGNGDCGVQRQWPMSP